MNRAERPETPARARGLTNDGKVTSDIVNDSYGTVDPADSTGLDEEENAKDRTPEVERDQRSRPDTDRR